MNRSMGVAGVIAGIVGKGEVVVLVFLTICGRLFPLGFPAVWVDQHSLALCPFLWQQKHSPSLMHCVRSAGESFFKQIISTSMALGSLVDDELEVKEERGRPCPFLRARM